MTKLDGKAPTILTKYGARSLTSAIRSTGALLNDQMVRAYTGRIWEVSEPSYSNFAAWCKGEIPEFEWLKLAPDARDERIDMLAAEGANIPEIVAATNSSLGTVHRRLVRTQGGRRRGPQTRRVNANSTPVTAGAVRIPPKTDRAVALLLERGPLDIRAITMALGCDRHEASATMTRLKLAKRVAYAEPARRGLFGQWYVTA
jgi:hypothetical protein